MKEVLDLLASKKMTLGCVESMTGGLFASELTSVAGASKVFKGGIVTYHTSEKINLLGIDPKVIEEFGVVSSEVAYAMAEKGRKALDVDVCVSVTGNAGPTCEPGGKPVGRVYIGFATQENVIAVEANFDGERNQIREKTVRFIERYILDKLF